MLLTGILLAVLPLVLGSLAQQNNPHTRSQAETSALLTAVSTGDSKTGTALRPDLDAIKHAGRIRILQDASNALSNSERSLLEDYAREQELEIDWVSAKPAALVFESLVQGKADIALGAGDAGAEPGAEEVQLSLPWGVSQQQVISRRDTGRIRQLDDLTTRQVAVKASSPLWQELSALASLHPSMSLALIPEAEGVENILGKVASAQYDVTIVDNLLAEPFLSNYLNLEVAFNATEPRMVSWAIRSSSTQLADSINSFINKQYLQSHIVNSYKVDLPQLQEKKLLRLITFRSPVNYYLHQGKLKGFEHDLVKRFAESHHLRLDVVIADSHEEMRNLLLAGEGDLVAASLPRDSFAADGEIAFSQTYNHAAPVVVGRTKDTPLLDAHALSGRRIVLPAASPYARTVERIQAQGVNVDLVFADPDESMETILFRVANGFYDLTVMGGHEIKAQFSRQINVRAHFALSEPLPLAWAVRSSDTLLLSSVNEYISKEFRKGFYNVLYAKYIDNPRPVVGDTQLLASVKKLSPYDEIVHKYAEHYDFDWRLIVAQMYQESQFNPNAISYAGAEGLMQLIPATADLLGIANTYDPDSSIQAGIRYMDYLRSKFQEEQLVEDRIWFSLAAYNAGFSRVQRARELAERMNLDKNKWFDNVEIAMMALSRPYMKEGELARNCNCGQTVVYVRDIRILYNNYVRLTRTLKTVSNPMESSKDI